MQDRKRNVLSCIKTLRNLVFMGIQKGRMDMYPCNLRGKYKDCVQQLKELSELPKTQSNQVYYLTHTYDKFPRRFYVEAPYTPDVFNAICAYIQFECALIDECYSMDQPEVIEILEKFYDCKNTEIAKGHEVDLYINWESFCGSKVQDVGCLKRDGMEVYFQKYINEFYKDEEST